MREHELTIPEIGLIGVTRVALGVGIGLLLSSQLSRSQRRTTGLALVLFGGLTTIPLALGILSKKPKRLPFWG